MSPTVGRSRAHSPIPARLDLVQSLTGLALALFMWTHLILVSSILLGKDAMLFVTQMRPYRSMWKREEISICNVFRVTSPDKEVLDHKVSVHKM